MTQTRSTSRPLVVTTLASAVAGLALGVVTYANRSAVREPHTPGTQAWPQHAIVAVVALLLLAGAAARGRLTRMLLAPVSVNAAGRLADTVRRPGPRAAAALLLVSLLVYCAGRAGLQVTAGLDPNFTANAWGGPGYVGAMACHYLDGALIAAAAAALLDRVLLPTGVSARRGAAAGSRR